MEFEQMIKWVASYLLIAASALGQVAVSGKAAISGQVVSGQVVLGAGVFTPPSHTTTLGSTILGASNQTCLDKDGDGYGVGPGCLGPDADDFDPSINTVASWTTRSPNLCLFLNQQRGYGITCGHVYAIATTGSDSNVCSLASPCATFAHVHGSLAPGDVLTWRGGTYSEMLDNEWPAVYGASGNPIVLIAYPGETVTWSATSWGYINNLGTGTPGNYITLDGFNIVDSTHAWSGMCVQIAGGAGATAIYGVTLRNIYCEGHNQGFNMQEGFHNVLVEDNVINVGGTPGPAMNESGPEHGIYFADRDNPSSGVTFRRNIIYNVGYNGIHYNGRSTNTVISQNIFYNFSSPAISPQNGGGGMVIRDNLIFNGHSDCIQVSPYSVDNPAPYNLPMVDAASMLIENNTCWTSQQDFAVGGPSMSDYEGIEWVYQGNPRSFKNTVVRNNIIYTHTRSRSE